MRGKSSTEKSSLPIDSAWPSTEKSSYVASEQASASISTTQVLSTKAPRRRNPGRFKRCAEDLARINSEAMRLQHRDVKRGKEEHRDVVSEGLVAQPRHTSDSPFRLSHDEGGGRPRNICRGQGRRVQGHRATAGSLRACLPRVWLQRLDGVSLFPTPPSISGMLSLVFSKAIYHTSIELGERTASTLRVLFEAGCIIVRHECSG